jgi:hypothetical protein
MKFLPSRCILSKMALIHHHSLKTIQAVLAIGRDSHHYARIDRAKKVPLIVHPKMDFSWQNLEQK